MTGGSNASCAPDQVRRRSRPVRTGWPPLPPLPRRPHLPRSLLLLVLFAFVALLCPACGDGSQEHTVPGTERGGAGSSSAPVVVTTTGGRVRGVHGGDVVSFFGLPYAAAPVGDLRWRAPAAPQTWQGTRDGSVRGHPCPQSGELAVGGAAEDCLFVNVTTTPGAVARAQQAAQRTSGPSGTPEAGAGRPVLVWIHGGGFTTGTANQLDTSALAAAGPAVIVSVNYRLGALGQLALPALNTESGGDAGSYAVADLIAALRWVRDNAAAFGGDPGNVTIFGESAGSVNACTLLAAPSARGLFQHALLQSGPCLWPLPTMATAERTGAEFAAQMGCTDAATVLSCLRAVPVDRLMAAGGQADVLTDPRWAPVTGSRTLPHPPEQALAAGSAARVPVLLGTVRDEGRAFTVSYDPGQKLTAERYAEIIRQQLPDRADAVLAAYPAGAVSARERLAQVMTDRSFACPTARTADLLVGSGSRAFLYEFDVPGLAPLLSDNGTGATHSGEMTYLFPDRASSSTSTMTTAAERELSAAMLTYWTRFAATGDPNVASRAGSSGGQGEGALRTLPTWPAWPVPRTATTPDRLVLEPGTIEARPGYEAEHHCDFWK
ncbi:para-nitrobenzyl esterase [Parafrankia irregularis]|uniref:Carboxylic ester hydrolase n=1 Tax=Parafrankia irregularis TaxID=795642 RepID=A0A0S4QPZ6_9ACTN|nr:MULTISPECIES: carboxylesterase family protein [Parafrankia]MBE3204215.1 carboxylesterase family protein [Parafrankia sp. CH37]CUU57183.1 para-nitrobenzyl esterase [Parafrankia irregularis]